MVLDYAEGGELYDYIMNKGAINEREARGYFGQIMSGVDFFHRLVSCLDACMMMSRCRDDSSCAPLIVHLLPQSSHAPKLEARSSFHLAPPAPFSNYFRSKLLALTFYLNIWL